MSSKEERGEDLNPRSKEVDEKVRQMMDPAIPDPVPAEKKKTADTPKIKQVDVKEPIVDETPPETAPELDKTVPVPKKGRKVIVPVEHAEEEPKEELPKLETPEPKKPLKIDVNDEAETPEDVAEKLDEAIAELDTETAPEPAEEEVQALEKSSKTEKSEDETADDLPKPAVVEDAETDKAVKDIVAKEGDELLEVEDAIKESEEEVAPEKKHRFSLKAILTSKKTVKAALVLLLLSLAAAAAYPQSRYGLLNLAGVRSVSTVTVLDTSTQQPLKNVVVSLGEVSVKTDANGSARLEKLRLGKAILKIERIAFASIEKPVTIGWGSNPQGEIGLTPTGAQYKLQITDVLSGKAVAGAEAENDEAAARADEAGLITLTIPQTDAQEMSVRISAADYRQETLLLQLSTKDTVNVKVTAARKHVFVSKRSGKYDIYSVYADGKDEKMVLPASGNEKDDLTLLPHPSKDNVAYVSTRAGKKNADGFVLSDLVILDPANVYTTPVATAERIQLVGWVSDRLVFVAIKSGESAATADRNRLLSYNTLDQKTTELAKSNYFNDLVLAQNTIYFAPSSAYAGGSPAQLFQVNADGSNQKSLYNQEVWNIIRTSYDTFAVSVGQQWFSFKHGDSAAKKLDSPPANNSSRVYLDNPSGQKSVWVDQRDGKGTLLAYDLASKTEATLAARAGIGQPVVWLNNFTLVFRVDNKDEVADYAISLNGGEAVKIKDVTKTSGIDNWYYY